MTTVSFTTAGTTPWVAPAGVYSVIAEGIGAGGGGSASNGLTNAGNSGGGGEYASQVFAVTPGNSYNINVGTGGPGGGGSNSPGTAGTDSTATFDNGTLTANGGGGGGAANGTTAGTAGSGSTNTTHNNGGAGAARSGTLTGGAGGGSSASAAAHRCFGWCRTLRWLAFVPELYVAESAQRQVVGTQRKRREGEAARIVAGAEETMRMPLKRPNKSARTAESGNLAQVEALPEQAAHLPSQVLGKLKA